MMRTVYLPDRNCLRHMKKSHVYRALAKRQTATASGLAESGIRPLVVNRGRASK